MIVVFFVGFCFWYLLDFQDWMFECLEVVFDNVDIML